jgi:hypothetical protein
MFQETHESLVQGHLASQHVAVDDRCRHGRDDPGHGPDLDRDGLPGRGEQPVVERPVGLISQALKDEGLPDAREMLQELQHQTLS